MQLTELDSSDVHPFTGLKAPAQWLWETPMLQAWLLQTTRSAGVGPPARAGLILWYGQGEH